MNECEEQINQTYFGTLIVHRSFVQNIKVKETQEVKIINNLLSKNLHPTYIFCGEIINENKTFGELIKIQKINNFDYYKKSEKNKPKFVIVCVLSPKLQSLKSADIYYWIRLTEDIEILHQKLTKIKNKKIRLEEARLHDISNIKALFYSSLRSFKIYDSYHSFKTTGSKNLNTFGETNISYDKPINPSESSLPILW